MRVRTMADIGAVVREAREEAGLTQVELAQRARVSREWLIKLETGRSRAEMPRVLDVLEHLGLGLDVQHEEH